MLVHYIVMSIFNTYIYIYIHTHYFIMYTGLIILPFKIYFSTGLGRWEPYIVVIAIVFVDIIVIAFVYLLYAIIPYDII